MSSAKECICGHPQSDHHDEQGPCLSASVKTQDGCQSFRDDLETTFPPKVSAKESWENPLIKKILEHGTTDEHGCVVIHPDYLLDEVSTLLQKEKEALVERIKEEFIEKNGEVGWSRAFNERFLKFLSSLTKEDGKP